MNTQTGLSVPVTMLSDADLPLLRLTDHREIIEGSWSSIGKKRLFVYNRMMDEENGLFSEEQVGKIKIDVDDIKSDIHISLV